MAKNLIPSCCKALTIHQKSAAKYVGHHMTVAYLATLTNDTSRSAVAASSPKTQRQKVNYSQAAEAARQQSTDSQRPYKQSSRKQESNSDARKRLNNIRFFYADPEIDKAIERPIIRLNPMTLMFMGVSNDNSHLYQSATYLRNEMPIRLAHFVKELRSLPFIVASNPAMLEIHERCISTFHSFEKFDREIKDIATERSFNQVVFNMLEMNKDLLALLCDGFKDARRYIKNDEELIRTSLNKILWTRLGIRLLCEHHIALNRQSDLNKQVLPTNDDDDDEDDHREENVDQYVSKYVSTTNGGSGSGGDSTRSNKNNTNWIGIFNKRFSPKQLVENSGKLATRICMDKYGIAPRMKIDGHTNAQFAYLPLPLEYILPELLKNAFRATIEHHNKSGSNGTSLPDVSVTIAVNEKDFIIRIRDRGGGIPHYLIDKIFDFHFTTADEKFRDLANGVSDQSSTSSSDKFKCSSSGSSPEHNLTENSGMGILCEATGTRGYSLMHGYGFGLPTSKAYAEYLGGSLTCQSMQGIGSDFYLRLGLLDVEHETVRI